MSFCEGRATQEAYRQVLLLEKQFEALPSR